MISPETRRNFNDFNEMFREIELEIDEEVDVQNMVVDRITSELDHRRLIDVLRWCDGDHYLIAEGFEEEDYESDDSGYEFGLFNDDDVGSNYRFSDPGYGSDFDNSDSDVSDIED